MNPGSVFESPFSGCDSHVSRADEQEVAGIAVSGPVVFQFPTFLKHQEPTEPGKFIVFPPTIRHRATPNQSEEDRITIAANAFPDGLINATGVSHLNVQVL